MIQIRIDNNTIQHLYNHLGVDCNAVKVDTEVSMDGKNFLPLKTVFFIHVGKPRKGGKSCSS